VAGDPAIRLTADAAAALSGLMAEESASNYGLRIQIVGGGCEGLYYDLDLVAAPADSDDVFTSEGVRVFVDRRARPLLDGTTVDFHEGFRFVNPNARRICRCGVSFR
jgi:iron-sulfur cluster assembly accessory protein